MTCYGITPAMPEHIAQMSGRWRDADVLELEAAEGQTPEKVLAHALAISPHAWTGFCDGVPICMFGVSPINILEGHGAPWMVGTVDLSKHALPFLRKSKRVVKSLMFSHWDQLTNWVDARNHLAVAWLEWLGFTVHYPAEPYGVHGFPFHRFEYRRG